MSLNLNEYQTFTARLNKVPTIEHVFPGLVEEIGELSGHLKRFVRDGKPLDREALVKESGDILWHWSEMNRLLGLSNQEVMDTNVSKLIDRLNRNVISGSGDNR